MPSWLTHSALVYEWAVSPNAGGGGEWRSLSLWVPIPELYTGAQINFEDLTPYLTCVYREDHVLTGKLTHDWFDIPRGTPVSAALGDLQCSVISTLGSAAHPGKQRVLNDLWRARLSRGRLIWFLAHPLSPPIPRSSVSFTSDTLEDWEKEVEKGGKGAGKEPNYTIARKLGPL